MFVDELGIPPFVEIPCSDSKLLYGIDPLILSAEDMTSNYAWYRLAVKHDPMLEAGDFKNYDIYTMYYLLSLGLLEFPVILIGGDPQSGKSLFMAWYTYQVTRLFKKRATLDWQPPEPERYGQFFSLFDEDFTDKIEKGFNEMAEYEKRTSKPVPRHMLENFIIYNTVFGLDECDSYAEKGVQTNLTKLLAMIGRRRRHTHTCMALVLIKTSRFAPMIHDLHTHLVDCIWEGDFKNTCSILIKDDRKNGTGLSKWLWLQPKDWTHLWHSHNIPAITHNVNVKFGNKPKKKTEEGAGL